MELQPSYTRSLGENPVQFLDERRWRLWASSLETPFGDLAGLLLAIYFGRW